MRSFAMCEYQGRFTRCNPSHAFNTCPSARDKRPPLTRFLSAMDKEENDSL